MKVAGKSKLQYFVEDLVKSCLTIVKVVLQSSFLVSRIKIGQKKRECIILGNGPSLKESLNNHPDFFTNKDLIAVNFFWKSDSFEVFKPKYYVIISLNYWITTKTDINDSGRKETFNEIARKVYWPMHLVVPSQARKHKGWDKELQQNPNISIEYLNITPVEGFTWFEHLLFNWNLGLPRPHNVLIPSIKVGIDLRYEKIYLFGAEHSWLKELYVDDENNVWMTQRHFYEQKNKEPEVIYHGTSNDIRNLAEVLMKLVHSFNSYWVLNGYAQYKDVKVFNATGGSFIDAFERIKI
jgi:hypothetical protein